ncbi:hypothetical protein D3C72_1430300 [compost metagenome]
MTSAEDECGAAGVGLGADVVLLAARAGIGSAVAVVASTAAVATVAASTADVSVGAGAISTDAAGTDGTGVATSFGGAVSTTGAGRAAGVDSSTGVRPASRAACRLAPSATTPMGGRLWPRSAATRAVQSIFSSTRLASMTTGSFSKKLPASAMRLASAAFRRSGSALCRTTRMAYRVALLKSRARDSVFILIMAGGSGAWKRRA